MYQKMNPLIRGLLIRTKEKAFERGLLVGYSAGVAAFVAASVWFLPNRPNRRPAAYFSTPDRTDRKDHNIGEAFIEMDRLDELYDDMMYRQRAAAKQR